MEGRLNCKLTADNAAHAKIRHLEDQVKETLEKVDQLEENVLENTNALDDHITQVSESLDTNKVTADTIDAETVDAVNVRADNINTLDITATAIDASVIDVESLKADALQGVTASVEEVIATTGRFTEVNVTDANIENVVAENLDAKNANLKGNTIIDGDIIFTKDTGLSKLEGNYLDIEASNITIENKNGDDRTALLVKDVDSLVEFEGKLKVHNDVEMENLTVNKEANLSDANLDNPTFENIANTQRVSTRCLDIDDNGKLVRLNIGEASDAVVTALVARGEDDLERVNISADGAYFNEPVKLNGETTIVSERVGDSDVLRATIANANITNGTVATLTATDAALENITTNLLNGKKFYENDWYDAIVTNGEEFAIFLVNTTVEYPKIMITRDISTDYFKSEYFTPVNTSHADIYCPKGQRHKVDIHTSCINKIKGTLTFHNLDVGIITDVYQRMGSDGYLQKVFFDNCTITMDMTRYAADIEQVDIMPLYMRNLSNSTINITPAAPADCKWQVIFYGGGVCKNSTINLTEVEGQTTSRVEFDLAENCTVTAYNITNDFYINTRSEVKNTFIDKDNIIKQVDISTLDAVYNKYSNYDAIVLRKADLLSFIMSVPEGQKRSVLYLNQEPLTLDTADVTTDPGTIGQTDVYLLNQNITLSDTVGSSTTYFEYVLSNITWHNVTVNSQVTKSNGNTVLGSLRLTDSILNVEEVRSMDLFRAQLVLRHLTNTECFLTMPLAVMLILHDCTRNNLYIQDMTQVEGVLVSTTYDTFIDVNTDLTTADSSKFLQYGAGANFFQYGSTNETKQMVDFTRKTLNTIEEETSEAEE